ncbi:hypothetical protein LCGC14_1844570 [marine sediment metagenome]|uniref:TonB C-terminal domain-containing protein n=1 Tax=marine sediment metagenome TaxID=412755 RepID=A0A0F9H0G4_9ZZZZ
MRWIVISIFTLFLSGFLKAQLDEPIVLIVQNSISDDSQPVFFIVDEMPVFLYVDCSGGRECLNRYLSDSLIIPSVDCSGTAYMEFIVDQDSIARNLKITTRVKNCTGHEKEIERLFSRMPKWIPGKQKGKPVRVSLTAQIDFNPKK